MNKNIRDRIRKLAAITVESGASEAEANFAAERLNTLLEEHEMTLAQVQSDDGVMERRDVVDPKRKTLHVAVGNCAWAIAAYTGAALFHIRSSLVVYGHPVDVEAAEFLVKLVRESSESEYRQWAVGQKTGRVEKNGFMIGFGNRIARRLIRLVHDRQANIKNLTGTELVVVDRSKQAHDHFKENSGFRVRNDRKRTITINPESVEAGQAAGARVQLHRGIAS